MRHELTSHLQQFTNLPELGKLYTFGSESIFSQNQHRFIPYKECEKMLANDNLKLFPEYFCLVPQSGSTPMMQQQLGAPLVVESAKGDRLVGILAYYPHKPWSTQLRGAYTNVTTYSTWIDDKIKFNLAAVSCETKKEFKTNGTSSSRLMIDTGRSELFSESGEHLPGAAPEHWNSPSKNLIDKSYRKVEDDLKYRGLRCELNLILIV